MSGVKSASRSKAKNGARLRPKLATTVARETLDAVVAMSGKGPAGEAIDQLLWSAVDQRIERIFRSRRLDTIDPANWTTHPRDAKDDLDAALAPILVREGKKIGTLSLGERERLRTKLASAHEARRSLGHFSPLVDVVRLFVVTHLLSRSAQGRSECAPWSTAWGGSVAVLGEAALGEAALGEAALDVAPVDTWSGWTESDRGYARGRWRITRTEDRWAVRVLGKSGGVAGGFDAPEDARAWLVEACAEVVGARGRT